MSSKHVTDWCLLNICYILVSFKQNMLHTGVWPRFEGSASVCETVKTNIWAIILKFFHSSINLWFYPIQIIHLRAEDSRSWKLNIRLESKFICIVCYVILSINKFWEKVYRVKSSTYGSVSADMIYDWLVLDKAAQERITWPDKFYQQQNLVTFYHVHMLTSVLNNKIEKKSLFSCVTINNTELV